MDYRYNHNLQPIRHEEKFHQDETPSLKEEGKPWKAGVRSEGASKDETPSLKEEGKPWLIAIGGATATGKSRFAIQLARAMKGKAEIISADSAQIYKELAIITARTTPEEMEGIPHHLSGFVSIDEDFSLALYQEWAFKIIKEIFDRGNIPILVGGTGLYIRSVLKRYRIPAVAPSPDFRSKMEEKAKIKGNRFLFDLLREKDPVSAERIHPHNLPRVIRALEVMEFSGEPFSSFMGMPREDSPSFNYRAFHLTLPREVLYQRIDRRAQEMIKSGGIKEIRRLLNNGKRDRLFELKILGVRETVYILEGLCSLEEGTGLLQRNTRKYAKRQLTWFRAEENMSGLDINGETSFRNSLEKVLACTGNF